MTYVCSPYSHPDAAIRQLRFEQACQAVAFMLAAGHLVFSPVCHSHPVAQCGLPTGWDFWQRLDEAFLRLCDEVVVLQLPGWEDSAGVAAELRLARALGKPIAYVRPEAVGVGHGSPTVATVATEAGR